MQTFAIILISAAAVAVMGAIAIVLVHRRRSRQILENLDKMLDSAINGDFSEKIFDESLLSSVESKLAAYLSAAQVSTEKIAAEKKQIKQLIADISHQTKTPITNLLLYAQLLSEQNLPAESIVCVTALNTQAEELSFLIDSLVKTSRLETGVLVLHPRQTALQPLLDSVLEQIAPRAKAKDIRLTMEQTPINACFDPKWTPEALYNIMDNAVKYTPSGGSIYIQAITYELFTRIDIGDTGIGIAEAEQASIFQRFYRSPAVSNDEGVGIGLYLARQIIAGQGGYIKVSSAPGQGSTFSVFLPQQT